MAWRHLTPRRSGGEQCLYNLACHYALAGEKDKAITTLGQAFHLNPGLIEWSTHDSDLDSVRNEPAFQSLVEVGHRLAAPGDGGAQHIARSSE